MTHVQYRAVLWSKPNSRLMLDCVGSSWDRTPIHRAFSSQHWAFFLPKPPAGFSRLCRHLPESTALHPQLPGIFCLIQVFCRVHYVLCASWAACSSRLVSGPRPAVLPRPEKATGFLPTTSPEALTGGTCRALKILGLRALSLTGDAAMGMGQQPGHGFSPGCWILRCSAKLHPALLRNLHWQLQPCLGPMAGFLALKLCALGLFPRPS